MSTSQSDATAPALDRQDARVAEEQAGLSGAFRTFGRRVRSGDLGPLPVAVGLVIIAIIFQALNSVFLSATNLVNLLYDSAAVGTISLGIVCVLILGRSTCRSALSVASPRPFWVCCGSTRAGRCSWPSLPRSPPEP